MSEQLKPSVSENDHSRGSKKPQLEIVEYGDFQCSFCGAAEPIVEEMLEEFGSAISFTFRNFPLKDVHPLAYDAAIAAESASRQGKYWEMHDLIYANQEGLSKVMLLDLAQEIGLDATIFKKDLQDREIMEKVDADFESGARSGVNGTPTFFVNGTRFDGGATDLYALIKENTTRG